MANYQSHQGNNQRDPQGHFTGTSQGSHSGSGKSATGNSNPGNFANDRSKASEAGRKGGQMSGGNFANDPQRAAEAGRKGGQNSHGGKSGTSNDEW